MPPVLNYPGTPGTTLRGGLPTPSVGGANAPASLRVMNWTNPVAPVEVGSLAFDTPIADMVFEDTRLNSEVGAVQVTQSSQSVVFDTFEFGAIRYRIKPELNEDDPTEPVWQVVVAFKPHSRWAAFPAADGYNAATDGFFPAPFKIEILNAADELLHTYEMRDGLPLNSPDLSQARTSTLPLRPHINMAMQLPWQSAKLKPSSIGTTWFPGVTSDSRHPRDSRSHVSTNAAVPLLTARTQINSALHWLAAPQWPGRYDNTYGGQSDTNALDPMPGGDPFLWNVTDVYTGDGSSDKMWRAVGWGYEPGSISCHDWYPGPGGSRFDRAHIPSVYSMFVSEPTGSRPKNSVPWRDMADAWTMAYFNHPYHYTTDVKTFAGINDAQILAREWSYGYSAYYGTGSTYVSGGATRHVNSFGIPNGETWGATDKDGKRHYNGVQFDDQHNYSAAGWAVLLMNSPMHVNSAKKRFASNTMCWLGAGTTDVGSTFGYRQHAWRWLHYSTMWAIGTGSHPLGHSRENIEAMFAQELEAIHDDIYVPAIVNNSTNFSMKAVRELGLFHAGNTVTDAGLSWYPNNTPLWFYIGGSLMLMKQSGLWAAMKARNSKCSLALDFVVECLDKFSCDFIVATNGRAEFTDVGDNTNDNVLSTKAALIGDAVMPTSWQNWADTHPAVGSESWIRSSSGALKERYSAQHTRAQWAFIRRDYFADHNPSRANITAACAIYDAFYAEYRASSGTSRWQYRIPAQGILNAVEV